MSVFVLSGAIRIDIAISSLPEDHDPFIDPPRDDGRFFSTLWWGTHMADKRPILLKLYRSGPDHPFVGRDLTLLTDARSPAKLTPLHSLWSESVDKWLAAFSSPIVKPVFELIGPSNIRTWQPQPLEIAVFLKALLPLTRFVHRAYGLYFGERFAEVLWSGMVVGANRPGLWVAFADYSQANPIAEDEGAMGLIQAEKIALRLFLEEVYPPFRATLTLADHAALAYEDGELIKAARLWDIAAPDFVVQPPSVIDDLLVADTGDGMKW
jgi:hypothetical protein